MPEPPHVEPVSPPRVLITAGPTHEPIDSVRYLANRSSGKMGIALAEASSARGWTTTLLLGPSALRPADSSHLTVHRFRTTADLQQRLQQSWPQHDWLIMAAAVADYRPKPASEAKLRRTSTKMTLELEPTPDLLAELAAGSRPDQRRIGFALEPADELVERARDKLARKSLDAIVANPLKTMDANEIEAILLFADGAEISSNGSLSKSAGAKWILDTIFARLTSPG
ncbi:MAG: phosphopantothenoylcysteine decarboxylase [Phycisphaerales bacterium]|nr:MAG: phosphopantothenoylcysteine decarboxylase [Phycisphaerales bacterium]